mmetsp:Transcript_35867/g.110510  ORF Transcript_35867/g.110510 Transcript_35867/m.110510 type:complete len:258 (+) Transcript_35867:399-1172(+)
MRPRRLPVRASRRRRSRPARSDGSTSACSTASWTASTPRRSTRPAIAATSMRAGYPSMTLSMSWRMKRRTRWPTRSTRCCAAARGARVLKRPSRKTSPKIPRCERNASGACEKRRNGVAATRRVSSAPTALRPCNGGSCERASRCRCRCKTCSDRTPFSSAPRCSRRSAPWSFSSPNHCRARRLWSAARSGPRKRGGNRSRTDRRGAPSSTPRRSRSSASRQHCRRRRSRLIEVATTGPRATTTNWGRAAPSRPSAV